MVYDGSRSASSNAPLQSTRTLLVLQLDTEVSQTMTGLAPLLIGAAIYLGIGLAVLFGALLYSIRHRHPLFVPSGGLLVNIRLAITVILVIPLAIATTPFLWFQKTRQRRQLR